MAGLALAAVTSFANREWVIVGKLAGGSVSIEAQSSLPQSEFLDFRN